MDEEKCCTIKNIKKILKFAKNQDYLLVGDILENIIIRVLSLAFNVESSESFGKYIYNNLKVIRSDKFCLKKWIDSYTKYIIIIK